MLRRPFEDQEFSIPRASGIWPRVRHLRPVPRLGTTRRGEGVGAGPSLGLTPGFHDKPRIPSSRLGKALPPGRHLVEFRYRPESFEAGLAITRLALLLATLALLITIIGLWAIVTGVIYCVLAFEIRSAARAPGPSTDGTKR